MEKQIYFIFVTEKVTLANVAQSCRQVGSLTPNLRVRQHSAPRDSALGGSVCSCKPAVKRIRTHMWSLWTGQTQGSRGRTGYHRVSSFTKSPIKSSPFLSWDKSESGVREGS